jgi:glycosyltransferase involved in cell wall biosynthesis
MLLSDRFDVVGVDVHPNPTDASGPFPFPVLKEADIPGLIAREDTPPIILNYTTPDSFIYYPGAVNIGDLYWETEAIPFRAAWPDFIQSMDHIWAPTTFVARFVRRCGYSRPITIVTWPQDLQPIADRSRVHGIQVHYVPVMTRHPAPRTIGLDKLRRKSANIFLAMQSLAPRKGLPILLSEWRDYVASNATDDVLLLKLRFIHSSRIGDNPVAQLHELLEETGFRSGDPAQIAMISEHLTDESTQALYVQADAYITASYGEGFGGSVAEALCHGRLVLAPRHTGMADLLAPDYPLAFEYLPRHVALRGTPSIYPHSSLWRLPLRGTLRTAIGAFVSMSRDQRAATLASARSHLDTFCSKAAVQSSLSTFFDALAISEASKWG